MQVAVCDVGPRDGLQNEQTVLEPPVRAELVNRLAAAGLPSIYSGLVLNAKGAERYAATGFLHGKGVETGVDLDALIAVSEWLESLLGRELPGQVYRAGAFAPVSG